MVSIIKSFVSKATCMWDHVVDCYHGHPAQKHEEWVQFQNSAADWTTINAGDFIWTPDDDQF
jgi:hypothetical protein